MRKAFIKTLTELANDDERIILLVADIGYTVVEEFADTHPYRFYNVGCAEQNMVGMATGIAQQGYFPFCYSITPFVVFRPFEFIRNACYQNFPIRIVGVGREKEYEGAGFTHWAMEDLVILRTLPNIQVMTPPTDDMSVYMLNQTWDAPRPIYYSLSKYDDTQRV